MKKDISVNIGRCHPCPHKCARVIRASGGWMFLACFHEPYRGKFVGEIKECPAEKEEKDDQ